MSKFATTIPVNVKGVIESLPKGAFVQGVRIGDDNQSIVIDWEHDQFKTPFTVPVEVTPGALTGDEALPDVVRAPAEFKKVQNEEVAPQAVRKAKKTL